MISNLRTAFSLAIAALLPLAVQSQPAKKNLHLFLLIGQSNMSGRAAIGPKDSTPIPRAWLFKSPAEWVPAKNPLNLYSTIESNPAIKRLGPGYTFTKKLQLLVPEAEIGLIANARGATAIGTWLPGTTYYKEAVLRAKQAQAYGTLKAVLWHQGEGDSKDPSHYLADIKSLITNLRKDLGNDSLPFIAGELGEYSSGYSAFNKSVYSKFVGIVPKLGLVQSDGLKSFDGIHFDTQGQYAMGEGYADQVFALVYKNSVALGAAARAPGHGIIATRTGEGIRFQVPADVTRIRLTNILGKPAGEIPIRGGTGILPGTSVPPGVYFLRTEGGGQARSARIWVP